MTTVIFSRDAGKDYSKLPKPEKAKINKKIQNLSENPFSGKPLGGELEGRCSLKAWPYRIIYRIEKNPIRVVVLRILHRQGAYN